MKIECVLKRQNGTVAEIDGINYHFAPQVDGAHVAVIEEVAHIERFLAIPEGYRIYREPEPAKVERKPRTKKADEAPEEPEPAKVDA